MPSAPLRNSWPPAAIARLGDGSEFFWVHAVRRFSMIVCFVLPLRAISDLGGFWNRSVVAFLFFSVWFIVFAVLLCCVFLCVTLQFFISMLVLREAYWRFYFLEYNWVLMLGWDWWSFDFWSNYHNIILFFYLSWWFLPRALQRLLPHNSWIFLTEMDQISFFVVTVLIELKHKRVQVVWTGPILIWNADTFECFFSSNIGPCLLK